MEFGCHQFVRGSLFSESDSDGLVVGNQLYDPDELYPIVCNRKYIYIYPPAPCAGMPIKSCARVRRCVVDPCGPRIEDVHGFGIEDCVDCFVYYVVYLCS